MNKNRNKIAAMMMVATITVSSVAMPAEAITMNNSINLESRAYIQDIEGNVEVEFNTTNFPDPGFREYIETVMGVKDGEIFNTRSVRKIIFSGIEHKTIKNLKGIEFFENLELLNCANNEIEGTVDLSRNKKLQTLDCSGNNITEIKMDSNTPLTELDCSYNQLTELNCLNNNTYITKLNCGGNRFKNLDVSTIFNLKELGCWENKNLEEFKLNDKLESFIGGGFATDSIDLSNNHSLKIIDCGSDDGNMRNINIDGCENLEEINLGFNKVEKINFNTNVALKKAILLKNEIKELNFSNCPELITLDCSRNLELNSLNIKGCTKLTKLDLGGTNLKNIDLTTNVALTDIGVTSYNIGYIDANSSINASAFGNNDLESFVEESLINLKDNEHTLDLSNLFPGINISKVTVLTKNVILNKNGILEWENKRPEEIEYIYDTGIKGKPLKVRLDLPYSDEKEHEKIIGSDRYETAAKIADKMGSYNTVILVNSDKTMADGLSAASLSGKKNAPILLVKQDKIPKTTMNRINKASNVYIIGGENAISKNVEKQLKESGKKINRISGKDRYDTSKKIAELLGGYDKAFIVNGAKGEADAMSVSAVAAKYGAPILLTNGKTSIHDKKSGVKYYAIGGTAVVDNKLEKEYSAERIAGSDRYATNRNIMDEFYWNSEKVYFAKGDTLIDALTASALAKDNGIVLVSKNKNHSELNGKDTVQVGGMNFEIDFE